MRSNEDIIGDLLIERDRQREQGREVPLTELCSECPELCAEVASRIKSLEATDWMFEETDGDSPDTATTSVAMVRRLNALQEATLDSAQVLDRLSEFRLVDEDSLSSIRSGLTSETRESGGALLQRLVKQDILTTYQALAICYPDAGPLTLGNYVVLDEIGQGGMGKVYRARHQRMKRDVALKVLPPGLTDRPEAQRRFEREVEMAAQLSHPNIVSAYDAGVHEKQHYLICEYVAGQTLREQVQETGPFRVAAAIDCIRQAAEGLAYAHAQGVVHRDITPNNIMLTQDGTVKLLDMGLARSAANEAESGNLEKITATGAVMGTASYMAPEQALNTRDADHRADIYSLGCTLFYLLTGRPPYAGETMMQKIIGHRETPIPELSSFRDDVPAALSDIFERMVAKRAEDRFQSMAEVLAALEEVRLPHQDRDEGGSMELAVVLGEPNGDEAAESWADSPTAGTAADAIEAPLKGGSGKRIAAVAVALAVLLGGGLSGVLLELRTEAGTVVLTSDDPSALQGATVTIDGQTQMTIDADGEDEPVVVTADAGKNRLRVSKGGFTTFTEEFEIDGGERKPIHVELVPLEAGQVESASKGKDAPLTVTKEEHSATSGAAGDVATNIAPVQWEAGPKADLQGLLMHPAVLPGVSQWQLESVSPRAGSWGADWHPEGKLIAIGGRLGQIRIYEAGELQLHHVAAGHDAAVDTVQWSPDGKWLASGSVDSTVRVWNASGNEIHLFEGHQSTVHEVAWAPDSGQFATVSHDRTVRFWRPDGNPGPVVQLDPSLWTLAWHPKGKSLVVAGGSGEMFHLSASGEVLGKIELESRYTEISAVAYDAAGEWLCVGGASTDGKGLLSILNSSGDVVDEFHDEFGRIQHVEWQSARDGFLVEEQWRAGLCQATAEGGFETRHFQPDGYVKAMAGSPIDERFVRVGTEDGVIRVYGPGTAVRKPGRACSTPAQVSFNPVDGSLVTAGSPQLLWYFSVGGEQQWIAQTEHGWLNDLAWHPSGDRFIKTGHGPIEVWNKAGERIRRITALHYPKQAAWSRDGEAFAVQFQDGPVGYFGMDGELRRLFGDEANQYRGFALHPEGELLVLIPKGEPTVELVDLTQPGTEPRDFGTPDSEQSPIQNAAWSPDGKWIAVERGKRWQPFEVWTAEGEFSERLGRIGDSNGFAWSPDGRRIVATSNRSHRDSDYWLAIYQIGTEKSDFPQSWIETHRHVSTSLDWSQDGTQIVSGSHSGVLYVHDADSGKVDYGVLTFADGQSVTFSAAGKILDGADDDLDEEVCYVVESQDGTRYTLRASEFDAFVESGQDFAQWQSDGLTAVAR